MAKIVIPVPPLEVQREVVNVLQRMEHLEAELEAELEARRTQYAHYREHLLTLNDDAARLTLGEILDLKFGQRITKAANAGTLYPVYGGGGESFRTDAYNRQNDWVVSRFAMSEKCVRRVEGHFWLLDSGFTYEVTRPDVDKDYLGQVLLSMQPIIFQTSSQSAQKNIDIVGFKSLTIALPDLQRQREVVSQLEALDAMVTSLTSGLPAEIAARQRQYEHYLDRLLTFKEKAA